jgi:hypothetical protein
MQRRQFLRFVWGRARLPPRGADAGRNLELQPFMRGAASAVRHPAAPSLPLPSGGEPTPDARAAALTDAAISAATRRAVAAAAAGSESDGGGGSEGVWEVVPKAPAATVAVQYQVRGAERWREREREREWTWWAHTGVERPPRLQTIRDATTPDECTDPLAVCVQDAYLPVAHTCYFSLELPCYSSAEVTRRRLEYAMTEGVAIDLDHTVAATAAWDLASDEEHDY